jgi:bacteriorhodopsin
MLPAAFVAACILLACTGVFYAMSFSHAVHRRTFHHMIMLVTGITSIVYLLMA